MKDQTPAAPPRTKHPKEPTVNNPTTDTTGRRWHVTVCTRCLQAIEPGTDAYTARTHKYEPMDPGPAWEATGDWADPVSVAGCLCGNCRDALQNFLMGWDDKFDRRVNTTAAYLAARESARRPS